MSVKSLIKQIGLLCLYVWRLRLEPKFYRFPYMNINKGKKAMVMGNGPSLRLLLDKYSKGEINVTQDSFFVNLSPLDESFYKIKPKHLFWSDYVFVQETEGKTAQIRKMYDLMEERIDWDLTVFLNLPNKKDDERLKSYSRLTNPHIHFVDMNRKYCDELCPSLRNWLYKKGLFQPTEGTVVITALYAAILEGYSEIELYGSELDMFKDLALDDDNNLFLLERHFYCAPETARVCHDGTAVAATIKDYLSWIVAMFQSHQLIRQFADYMGCKIYNCTPGSMVDAYERRNTLCN